jgi:hypothetical protein
MNLKIHATLPGSEFNLTSSLNLLPFQTVLNKIFKRIGKVQFEAGIPLTLEQARELRLFADGWLPDILPRSTHNIQVMNNLRLHFSQGEFHFSPRDWPEFSAYLKCEKLMSAPFVNWAKSLRKMQGEGHTLWNFSAQDRHWVFFCKADTGYCEYVMWYSLDTVLI